MDTNIPDRNELDSTCSSRVFVSRKDITLSLPQMQYFCPLCRENRIKFGSLEALEIHLDEFHVSSRSGESKKTGMRTNQAAVPTTSNREIKNIETQIRAMVKIEIERSEKSQMMQIDVIRNLKPLPNITINSVESNSEISRRDDEIKRLKSRCSDFGDETRFLNEKLLEARAGRMQLETDLRRLTDWIRSTCERQKISRHNIVQLLEHILGSPDETVENRPMSLSSRSNLEEPQPETSEQGVSLTEY